MKQIASAAATAAASAHEYMQARMEARYRAGTAYFAANAQAIARCAATMADRFFAGGTLFIAGGGVHATDAEHNAVEFVHPALPGCRALPAISLAGGVAGTPADRLQLLGGGGDILLAFAPLPAAETIVAALETARAMGMHTIALTSGAGGKESAAGVPAHVVLHAGTGDASVAQELQLATYHMLWELVHIVLNHRGIAAGDA